MSICAEYLHIPHYEFKQLPYIEQLKWYTYVMQKGKYLSKKQEKRENEIKMAKVKKNAPSSPGLKR